MGPVVWESRSQWPSSWTKEQWMYFNGRFTWIYARDGRIGCSICQEVQALGPNRETPGMKFQLAKEWVNTTVIGSGDLKDKQNRTLRKKIYEHSNSKGHKQAAEVLQVSQEQLLKTIVSEQQTGCHLATCNVFRTAYYIAKNDRPYTDFTELLLLQQLNGVKIGRVLHSKTVCVDIIDEISSEMKKNVLKTLVVGRVPFSIMIDESTSLGQKTCLIVYIRCSVDKSCEPISFFLDILELSETNASGLCDALLSCLFKHGFDSLYMHECWVGIGTDGASVMLGRKSGVVTQLQVKYPNIIAWHF